MIIKIKRRTLEQGITALGALFIIIAALIGVSFTTNYAIGATNITNVSVVAKLNVTNTQPNITSVIFDDGESSPANEIDLTANSIKVVTCNATVQDFNGWQDIDADSTNATIFVNSVGKDADPDNNHLYINRSCGRCVQGTSSTQAICDCRFPMQYYTNASDWTCNISITDRGGTGRPGQELNFSDSRVDGATVTKLLALDTPVTIIDYGNLSVTQTSAAIMRNVTNVGNLNFNLTLRGFGGDNESIAEDLGSNVTMICEVGNISFGNHRYVVGNNVTFGIMRNLTNKTRDSNFTFFQKTNDNAVGLEFNETFWRLQIPLSVGGLCNGTIIFGAREVSK